MAAAKKEEKVVAEPVTETVAEPAAEVAAEPVAEAPKKRGRKPGSSAKTTKAEVKTALLLQYDGSETDISLIEDKVKAEFVKDGHRAGNIKSLTIYVKPEDNAAYYVINDKFTGRVDLF